MQMWVLPGKKWVCSREWDYYIIVVAVVFVVVVCCCCLLLQTNMIKCRKVKKLRALNNKNKLSLMPKTKHCNPVNVSTVTSSAVA